MEVHRTTSGFNLSIGTGIAMESLYEPQQEPYDGDRKVTKIDINNFDVFDINIRTLIRNYLSSLDKDTYLGITPQKIAEDIIKEIETIEDINHTDGKSHDASDSKINISLFDRNYESWMNSQSRFITWFEPKSLRDQRDAYLTNGTLKILRQSLVLNNNVTSKGRVLLLSHHAVDLLTPNSSVSLLESHTGKLKTKSSWNSKYKKSTAYTTADLPFQKKLLFIMGTHDKMIVPFPIKTRQKIIEILSDHNVTPLTTEDRVKLILDLNMTDMLFKDMWAKL